MTISRNLAAHVQYIDSSGILGQAASLPTQTSNSGKFLTTNGTAASWGNISGNISFPATQVSSTNANTLDDYEEGTFTPTDASGVNLVFTSNTGYYIKIGRIVHCYMNLRYPSTADGNAARISLPFPVVSTEGGGGSLMYFYNGSGVPNTVLTPYPLQYNGVGTISLNQWSSSGQASNAYCSLFIFRIFVTYFSDV